MAHPRAVLHSGVFVVVLVALASLPSQVSAEDPTYCLEYEETTSQCNCHACNCQICHTCTCETKIPPWSSCSYDSCGNHGCWCSPGCRCCYSSNCRTECNCQQCCDTCTETVCSRHVTYSVHDINPTFVQSGSPTAITVTGGYFVSTTGLKCKFGSTVVTATLKSNNEVSCTPPAQTVPAGQALTTKVAVSLDNGEHWTTDDVELSYVNCTNGCSGHGSCDARSHCVCDALYTGTDCSHLCPVDGSGATCSGHGACTLGGGCQCQDGYWGALCAGVCPVGTGGKVCSGSAQGSCSSETGLCVCVEGYTGDSCQHAGTCQEHGTDCQCSEKGYWGPGCSNTCKGSTNCVPGTGCETTCSNHGLCADSGECLCDVGYYGDDCASSCPSSNGEPCSGHSVEGTCDKAGHCVCSTGWSGIDCSTECPGGSAAPCSNHGVCTLSGLCVCSDGYSGTSCELQCPTSGGQPCGGNGACTVAGTCNCHRGYYGNACQSECPGGATLPCNGHGNCDASGKCVCDFGFYGTECATVCPGGSATPCSEHGTCDSNNGVCGCDVGYYGADCSQACPSTVNGVCNGHGACGSDGKCKCNAPYQGDGCETVYCPYDCYSHGSCDDKGVCHCQGGWTGIYCSTQVGVDPLTGGTANFMFQNGYVRTREDAGTIFLNVTRGGSTYGEVYVWYQTQDASAHAHSDYMPTSGKLTWLTGDATSKQIQVDVIGDDHPEGLEAFIVYLFNPSPGSTVGDNATVTISANGNADTSTDSVIVTVKVNKAEEDLRLSTAEGAAFADQMITDFCGPNVLHVSTDRMVVRDVQSSGAHESFVTFVLLGDAAGPPTDDLAEIIWEQMTDASSALYEGTATRYININFQPVFKFSAQAPADDSPTYWWLLGIFIPLVLIAVCAVVGYRKRHQLTEWALWRLGNFRFNSLMRHRNLDLDEDRPADKSHSGRQRPGDEVDDTRL